jgi:hypothetical protein
MMDGLALCGAIEATLKLRKELGRLILFSCGNESDNFLLGQTSMIQKKTVHSTTTQSPTGLFCSRSSIGHKVKECPKTLPRVNP